MSSSLREITEARDGSTGAFRHTGGDIPVPARFALLYTLAVLFDHLGGPKAAVTMVRHRAGRWFRPELAETFLRSGPDLLRRLAEVDVARNPGGRAGAEPSHPTDAGRGGRRVFADMVDLKTPFTLGHFAAVADLAAARQRRLSDDDFSTLRRAALLHDLGRVAVSGAVWEHPRPLTTTPWEQVRLHPYHTERILDRSKVLAPLARMAGMHHERLDGSRYHHRVGGVAIPPQARLLGAADAFQAMTQDRPYRSAKSPEQAAGALEADAAAGRFDVECVGRSSRRPVNDRHGVRAPGPLG